MDREITGNYINAKERLATCANFGIKVTCNYIGEGRPETCLECHNYLNPKTLELEDLASMGVMSSLLSSDQAQTN